MAEAKNIETVTQTYLEAIGPLYTAALESTLSNLSGEPVGCTFLGQNPTRREELLPLVADWSLMLEVTYASAPPGRLGFFFKPQEARRLCHRDREAAAAERVEVGAETIAALQSVINQTTDLVGPPLQPAFAAACSPCAPGDPHALQQSDSGYFAENAAPILATIMVEVESIAFAAQILLLVSPALADALRARSEPASSADRAAPAYGEAAMTPGRADARTAAGPAADPKENTAARDLERNLERILDIELPVALNFGQVSMLLKDLLHFSPGSIIQLDRTVDDPVFLVVNNKVIARGEVVIVDGNYGIRINEIESKADRIRSLR